MGNVYSGRVPVPRQDKLKMAVVFILYFIFGIIASCYTGNESIFLGSLLIGILASHFKSDISRGIEVNRRLVVESTGEDLICQN